MRDRILFFVSVLCFLRCEAQTNTVITGDPCIPKLRTTEKIEINGGLLTVYRFTEDQLSRMEGTKLETNRLVAYLEKKWSVERLKAYCTKSNRFPKNHQNLVALNCPVETDLHKGRVHDFDRIWVYVSEDNGRGTYIESVRSNWHRWTYSINLMRGKRHWVIFEDLPNDFVDSSRYDPK